MNRRLRPIAPVLTAGVMLGCGMGALFDGILLHQILQWHNMLSSVHPPVDLRSMKYNMLWDGLFHAVAWAVTATGVVWLWTAGKRPHVRWSRSALMGGVLAGWGAFNLLEGLVDHHVLSLHHVHPGRLEMAWDIGFLAWGAGMLAVGAWLSRRSVKPHTARVVLPGRY